MLYAVSKFSGKTYVTVAKPLLFKFSPDKVHSTANKIGKTAGAFAPTRILTKTVFAYENAAMLGQTIHNIYFKNPVGLSAGFDKDFELLRLLPNLGFGFAEGGSLTFHASSGNPKPHYRRLPASKSILVNAGLNNDGVHTIVNRIKKQGDLDYPLNISVAKTNSSHANTMQKGINDYLQSLKVIQKANVGDVITLNISCPNAYGGEPFTTPKSLDALLDAVAKLTLHQPIFIKMPIDKPWNEFEPLLKVLVKHRITGVTIGNLAKDRNNMAIKNSIPQHWQGNLSGKPTTLLSNELIHQTYKHYGDKLTIIGVGGIFNAQDAYEKIKHGASLVELITGLIFEGPQLIGQINHDLVQLLKKDGYTNITQAIGAYHKKV